MEQELPKALTPFFDSTFLQWQIQKFENISDQICVVVSTEQITQFEKFRSTNNLKCKIITQHGGKGSYFAVKTAVESIRSKYTLVCWADQVGLSKSLILQTVNNLQFAKIDGLVPLLHHPEPYVKAVIDLDGRLEKWEYRREGDSPGAGYTDLGFFAFNTESLRNSMNSIQNEKFFLSKRTNEFNFLDLLPYFSKTYSLEFLFTQDKLNAVAINTKNELVLAQKILDRKRMRSLFSIIIPSFNEAARLPALLSELANLCNSVTEDKLFDLEVIFVDDGSTDATSQILLNYPFRYLYQKNSGKGSAVKLGTSIANGDYILILDADGEYLVSDIPLLVQFCLLNPASVVYGSRYLTTSSHGIRLLPLLGQSILNLYFNYILSILIWLRFKIFITDSLTGYKIYPRGIYNSINPITKGFETDHELSKKILERGISIAEFPVSYMPRTKKDGKKISTIDALKALRMWLR